MTGVLFEAELYPESLRGLKHWTTWIAERGYHRTVYVGVDEATARSLCEWLEARGRRAFWGPCEVE